MNDAPLKTGPTCSLTACRAQQSAECKTAQTCSRRHAAFCTLRQPFRLAAAESTQFLYADLAGREQQKCTGVAVRAESEINVAGGSPGGRLCAKFGDAVGRGVLRHPGSVNSMFSVVKLRFSAYWPRCTGVLVP